MREGGRRGEKNSEIKGEWREERRSPNRKKEREREDKQSSENIIFFFSTVLIRVAPSSNMFNSPHCTTELHLTLTLTHWGLQKNKLLSAAPPQVRRTSIMVVYNHLIQQGVLSVKPNLSANY